MSPEQKISLRVTSLQHTETINHKYYTGSADMPKDFADKVLREAEEIYQYLTQDANESTPILSKIKN